MRTLEVRRHAFTKKGAERGAGSHLSQEGVTLARQIGGQIGPFALVQVSPIPRTMETAIAMGFAVDAAVEPLGPESPDLFREIGHLDRWSWPNPFVEFVRLIGLGNETAALSKMVHMHLRAMLAQTPEGGQALAISHGRVIECGLVPFVTTDECANWGDPFRHGEGARIVEGNDGKCTVTLLRLTA